MFKIMEQSTLTGEITSMQGTKVHRGLALKKRTWKEVENAREILVHRLIGRDRRKSDFRRQMRNGIRGPSILAEDNMRLITCSVGILLSANLSMKHDEAIKALEEQPSQVQQGRVVKMDVMTRERMTPAVELVQELMTRVSAAKPRTSPTHLVESDSIVVEATHGRRKPRHFSVHRLEVNLMTLIAHQATDLSGRDCLGMACKDAAIAI